MWSENGCHVENDIFWSKIGLGFGEPGAKPLPRIPRSIPPPTGLKDPTLPSAEPSYRLLLFSYSQKKKTKEGAARRVGRCRGGTAHKTDGAARRRISRTPLKGTRILFYLRVPNSLPSLERYRFKTIKLALQISIGNKDNFRTLSSQGLFETIVINLYPNQSF